MHTVHKQITEVSHNLPLLYLDSTACEAVIENVEWDSRYGKSGGTMKETGLFKKAPAEIKAQVLCVFKCELVGFGSLAVECD